MTVEGKRFFHKRTGVLQRISLPNLYFFVSCLLVCKRKHRFFRGLLSLRLLLLLGAMRPAKGETDQEKPDGHV